MENGPMGCLKEDFAGLQTSFREIASIGRPILRWSSSWGVSQFLAAIFAILVASLLYMLWKRWYTRRILEQCGLPTVFWRPKFVNYLPEEHQDTQDKKLATSTITNILPRMERLNGPYNMYGTVYGLSTAVVHVAHPVPASAILSSSRSCAADDSAKRAPQRGRRRSSSRVSSSGASKAPAYNHFKNFCGEGVFTADGEDWREKRAAVVHALMRGCDKEGFEAKVEREAHRTANLLMRELGHLETCPALAVETNIVPLLQRATVGLVYRYITHNEMDTQLTDPASHEQVNSLSTESSVSSLDSVSSFQGKSKVGTGLLASYLQSITRIRMIILAQSRSIWFLLPRWCYRIFSSMYREEERTMGPIREFSRVACRTAQPDSPLAQLRASSIYKSELSKVSKNLLDEAITLLFAGQDTSAATLSWTLHLLSLYPTVQDKLANEVRSVLGSSDTTEPFVTKKMQSNMPYLDAVIKESMRLYPVAPFVVRKLPFPVSVEAESKSGLPTVLPSGSIACIWIYGLHHNPQFWKRPQDFVPERWLDEEQRDEGITCGAYMPFAVGPRNCIGQPLANIILRSLLARLIHRYEFRDARLDADDSDPKALRKDMQVGFTVLPKGGVTLSVHKRSTTC